MARPRKDQQQQYRLPTYHGSNRWRLRIDHAHGEKVFWWPAAGPASTPPPEVVAAAVAAQDQWRALVKDWNWVRLAMKLDRPEKDWSKPAWVERAEVDAAMSRIKAKNDEEHQANRRRALHHVAVHGVSDLIGHAQQPGALAFDGNECARLRDERPDLFRSINEDAEQARLQVLRELAPARRVLRRATVRDALTEYLRYHETRTKLKVGDWIKSSTFKAMRKMLLAAFGLSATADMSTVRDVGIKLDGPFPEREGLESFARHWHAMPEGVNSSRTVRNWLREARAFFRWCECRDFGFVFPSDVARLFTAEDVETPAESFDAERIRRILAQGKTRGQARLKMYTLLGLMNGYGQTDCAEIARRDYFAEDAERFIKRYRSKESRPKRGSRPIRIKHWIAPELASLMDAAQGFNAKGYLFNSERGKVLVPKLVTNIWTKAVADAGDNLSFKQLRKMGYNRIKHHASSREVAELWDGHSGGIADPYDDGIFVPVIHSQQKFAEELRAERIL